MLFRSGEYVLVLEGRSAAEKKAELSESWREVSIKEHMKIYEDKGISGKEAMKLVAADRGVPKREIYQYLINEKNS